MLNPNSQFVNRYPITASAIDQITDQAAAIRDAVAGPHYKPETIRKYLETLLDRVAFYRAEVAAGRIPKVCITSGNSKIGNTLNVSLASVASCIRLDITGRAAFIPPCITKCYDLNASIMRPCVLDARARNYALALYAPEEYFKQIRERLQRARRARKAFRWHVGGEILNAAYFSEMVAIAKEFPAWTFWTYTKQYSIVNDYIRTHGGSRKAAIPANLSVMFSIWEPLPLVNPYGMPTFEFVPAGGKPKHKAMRCPGNCNVCIENGIGCPAGRAVYNGEHGNGIRPNK